MQRLNTDERTRLCKKESDDLSDHVRGDIQLSQSALDVGSVDDTQFAVAVDIAAHHRRVVDVDRQPGFIPLYVIYVDHVDFIIVVAVADDGQHKQRRDIFADRGEVVLGVAQRVRMDAAVKLVSVSRVSHHHLGDVPVEFGYVVQVDTCRLPFLAQLQRSFADTDPACACAEFASVGKEILLRDYFCFFDYEYILDVSKQNELMPDTISLEQGLKEEFEWYKNNLDSVYNRKPYMEYIDNNLVRK